MRRENTEESAGSKKSDSKFGQGSLKTPTIPHAEIDNWGSLRVRKEGELAHVWVATLVTLHDKY